MRHVSWTSISMLISTYKNILRIASRYKPQATMHNEGKSI